MGVNLGPVTVPPASPTVLGAVNFSSAGPVAGRPLSFTEQESKNKSPPTGSLAATVQSSIGYTNNGGSFAMAQSVAMGGANVRMVGYAIVALAVGSGACLIVRGMSFQDV